jgi:hypothetical protein
MENQKTLKIEATGREENLNVLINFLRMVQYCGDVGSTRTIELWVDGDGAARMNFDFPEVLDLPEQKKQDIDGRLRYYME